MNSEHNDHHKDPAAQDQTQRGGLIHGVTFKAKNGLSRWKHRWIRHTVEAPLPHQITNKVPAWVKTRTGRVVVGVASLSMVLGWAVVLFLVIG